jgi:LCP family protein required for cell wall assembly
MPKSKKVEPLFQKEVHSPVPPKMDKKRVLLSKIKRRFFKHVWLLRSFILIVVLVSLGSAILGIGQTLKKTSLAFYFGLAKDFIFAPQSKIDSVGGITNILILGKGGQGHDAPDLTDTMIFVSINLKDPLILMISLPRDIWIPSLRAKLNSVYYWGNQKKDSGGLILAKSVVEEIVGQPIHYALVIDFSGFRNIIDTVGGIDVEIERSFTDNHYPIAGRENDGCDGDPEYKCRYEVISFTKGKEHMDGELALKFVRSRNAEGEEGTDLARGTRQEKVISALKVKILGREVLLSPKKMLALKKAVLENIETDITPSAAAILTRKYISAKGGAKSFVLPERFLVRPDYSPKYDNLYIFLPKVDEWDDWTEVHTWISCELTGSGNCDYSTLQN